MLLSESIYKISGAPGAIRTPDRWYRKPVLYPAELRAHTSLIKETEIIAYYSYGKL